MTLDTGAIAPGERLDAKKVTLVYTMAHQLGDFVVMGALLKKFDFLQVEFESLVMHRDSPHVSTFDGVVADRFFNVARMDELIPLIAKLRRQKQAGRIIFGIPMAPGSLQAFFLFWILKKLVALTYIVDFNLINADIITPPRRRYIFDRHLAQAAELFKRPDWATDLEMPLAIKCPSRVSKTSSRRIGFFPLSGRRWLPEFQWPDNRWVDLAKRILETPGWEIVLLGKGEHFVRFETILRSQLPEQMRAQIKSCVAASVESLVAGLQDLDCVITLNTSALHLAHALRLPAVVLCGSSADFWLPEGAHIRIVRDAMGMLPPSDKSAHDPLQPSLQRIEVADVFSAFEDISRQLDGKAR